MTRAALLPQPLSLTPFLPPFAVLCCSLCCCLLFRLCCCVLPPLQVRFFGKFLGTHTDYFVFETTLKSPPEEPEQQLGESRCVIEHCRRSRPVSEASTAQGCTLQHLIHSIETVSHRKGV